MSDPDSAQGQTRLERIWDLPLRLFHWLLAGCVMVGWYLGYFRDFATIGWHFWLGYAVCGLLGFRLLWGLVGPRTARFSSLIWSPRAIVSYAGSLGHRSPSRFAGHSPIGSCSVIAMLASLVVQVVTGLSAEDDALFATGPLAEWLSPSTVLTMTNIHYINSRILFGLMALHVAAILWYLLWKRENLIRGMITGWKSVFHDEERR